MIQLRILAVYIRGSTRPGIFFLASNPLFGG